MCPKCGYDVSSLVDIGSLRCPECGVWVDQPRQVPRRIRINWLVVVLCYLPAMVVSVILARMLFLEQGSTFRWLLAAVFMVVLAVALAFGADCGLEARYDKVPVLAIIAAGLIVTFGSSVLSVIIFLIADE